MNSLTEWELIAYNRVITFVVYSTAFCFILLVSLNSSRAAVTDEFATPVAYLSILSAH